MQTRMQRRQQRVKRERKDALIWGLELLAVVLVSLFIREFVFSLATVQGPSMQDTLSSGQVVAVSKMHYRLNGFARGDVVICMYPDSDDNFIKRIAALPGDTVEIKDGITYINGQAQPDAFVDHPAQNDFAPYLVEEGVVFVMGDNRGNSHDSRAVGALGEDMIVGRVFAVIFPFDQVHKVAAGTP